MPDTDPVSPPLHDMRSTEGTLIITGPGGTTTSPLRIVHVPGDTPPTVVHHDATACGCRR